MAKLKLRADNSGIYFIQRSSLLKSSGSFQHAHQSNAEKESTMAKSLRALLFSIMLVMYGLACYRIGEDSGRLAFGRDSSKRTASIDSPLWSPNEYGSSPFVDEPTINDDDEQARIESSEMAPNAARLAGMASATRSYRRIMARNQELPYECGLVFFYHVPATGGATVNQWLLGYSPDRNGTVPYFTHWGMHRAPPSTPADAAKSKTRKRENVQNSFVEGMDDHVRNLRSGEWRIAQAHHNSLHLNESEHHLRRWRSAVESRGCQFVAITLFRDALSHTLSLFRHQHRCGDCTTAQWLDYLNTTSQTGYFWSTQLDFFLYGFLTRNPHHATAQDKVRRGIQLLRDHFDFVSVAQHDLLKRAVLRLTGWEDKDMTWTNTHDKKIVFSKKELEYMQRLLKKNGDIDFMDQVKFIYQNFLSLFVQ